MFNTGRLKPPYLPIAHFSVNVKGGEAVHFTLYIHRKMCYKNVADHAESSSGISVDQIYFFEFIYTFIHVDPADFEISVNQCDAIGFS